MHVTDRVEVGFTAGMDDFYFDSVEVGDETGHSDTCAEFSLFDEVDCAFTGVLSGAMRSGL